MRVTLESYWRRRVQRGAMWLDMTRPGWYRQIDLVRLRLSRNCNCIVGQLSGEFLSGVEKLMPAGPFSDYGVSIDVSVERNCITSYYGAVGRWRMWHLLDRLWTAEINERLALWEANNSDRVPSKRECQQKRQRQEWLYETASV